MQRNKELTLHHNYSIDVIRIIAVFGIVWFHSPSELNGRSVAYSGLIVFIEIAIAFLVARCGRNGFLKKRFKRIIIPWAFWISVYGAVNIIMGRNLLPYSDNFIAAVLTGTRIHLWYLPFLFIASLFVCLLHTGFSKLYAENLTFIFAILSIVALSAGHFWREWSMHAGAPWAQWIHALPAVFIGALFGYCQNSCTKESKTILSVTIFLIFLISGYAVSRGHRFIGIPYLIGTMLVYFAHRYNFEPGKARVALTKLSELTFGVYLIHLLVKSACYRIFTFNLYFYPIIIFFVSLASVFVIKKLPFKLANHII